MKKANKTREGALKAKIGPPSHLKGEKKAQWWTDYSLRSMRKDIK